VDDAPTVQVPDCGGKTDRNAEELSHLHPRSDQLIERLAPGILEDERGLPLVLREFNWPNCPCRIQFGPQGVLVFHHPDTVCSRML
jgi:hypothetical protein